jgi:hypothetical protein
MRRQTVRALSARPLAEPDSRLARVAEHASEDAGGVPADLLDGYLELLAEVSSTGRRPDVAERETRREVGVRAAEHGIPLRDVIDLYLSATWLAWPLLPGVMRATGAADLRTTGEAIFRAADASVIALTDGYEGAQRLAIRQEEARRREFIDELLSGGLPGRLMESAERFGLRLAGPHAVAAARAGSPFLEGDLAVQQVMTAMVSRFGGHQVLVTTKDGLLVCVAAGEDDRVLQEFARQVGAMPLRAGKARIGIGRPNGGPGGVVRSFEQARSALQFASRLGLTGEVFKAADLLVFQVLARDGEALTELVNSVLGPLRRARGGPRPLVDTLVAYFDSNSVAASAARALHIGVRTISYRLNRVSELSGYSVGDPAQRFTLQVAVRGAQLLGWPEEPGEPPEAGSAARVRRPRGGLEPALRASGGEQFSAGR